MRTVTPLRALVLCAMAALAVTGCTAKHASGPTPTYYESWSPEQEAQAVQGAEQAVRDWMHVSFQCLADPPNTDPSCFDQIDVDDQLTKDRDALKNVQDYGWRYVGDWKYVRTERVVSVDLPVGPDKEVQLSVCADKESWDVLGPDGTSVVPADYLRRERSIYIVRKHSSEWQVAGVTEDPEGIECD